MPLHAVSTHPGFTHSFPFGRRPGCHSDMGLALAEDLARGLYYSMDPSTSRSSQQERTMLLDVKETEEAIEVKADMPGVGKGDINVDIDNNVITLTVQQHEENKHDSNSPTPETALEKEQDQAKGDTDSSTTWHHTERSGVFAKRSIRLPETADTTAGNASYEDGVLSITFPKKAPVDTTMKLTIH